MKISYIEREKIYANHKPDKGLVNTYNIERNFQPQHKKNRAIQLDNGQKI